MSTLGALELRMHGKTNYVSVLTDGCETYSSIVELVKLYDDCAEKDEDPTEPELQQWFDETIEKIFTAQTSREVIAPITCEVVIDSLRRIIVHDGDPSNYCSISDTAEYTIAGALDKLVSEHNYHIFEMTPLFMREQRSEDARKCDTD